MKNFGIGLSLFLNGMIIWFIATYLTALAEEWGLGGITLYRMFDTIGVYLMFLGPLAFWVAVPIWEWLRRKK